MELNHNLYRRTDATTYERKKYDNYGNFADIYNSDDEEDDKEPREPMFVNHRVDVGWGFCDKKGKVWKVSFYEKMGTVKIAVFIK